METSYLPVQWCYREQIEEEIEKQTKGKIFYFGAGNVLLEHSGKILSMEEIPSKGVFIKTEPQTDIRIDRIVTLFGKPAAAYEEYDAYSNACMECMGGYTKEELDDI